MKKLLSLKNKIASAQIESFLAENGFPPLVKNTEVQALVEPGELGSGYNLALGPIEIWLDDGDIERARELLGTSVFAEYLETPFEKQPTGHTNAYINSIRSIICCFVWLLGIGNILGIIFAVCGLKREPKKGFAVFFLVVNIGGLLGSVFIDLALLRNFL